MAEIDRVDRAIEVVERRRRQDELYAEVRRRLWDVRSARIRRLLEPWAEPRTKGEPR